MSRNIFTTRRTLADRFEAVADYALAAIIGLSIAFGLFIYFS
jgi:uncharacterized membrane protein YgaE (UPF0421/DUF939 family)